MTVQIYTDGGCWNMDNVGGYAALMFVDGVLVDGVYGGNRHATNNTMELAGLIAGMKLLPTVEHHRCTNCGVVAEPCCLPGEAPCPIVGKIKRPVYSGAIILSDSQYCVKGATSWVHGWAKGGWRTADKKPVKNRELWEEVMALSKKTGVTFEWVRGHNGDPGNELADLWATKAKQKTAQGGTQPWEEQIAIGG